MINLQDMNIQQKIADYLADERLDDVNASSQPVVYKDTLYTKYIKRIFGYSNIIHCIDTYIAA